MRGLIGKALLALGMTGGLVGFAIVIGETAGQAGAAAVTGVIFGVFAGVLVGLMVLLISQRGARRTVRYEHHRHYHDNRKALIYMQHADGSLELLQEMDARLLEQPQNGVSVTVKRV